MIYTNLTSTPFIQSGSALLTASAMPKPYPVSEMSASGNVLSIGNGTASPGTVPIMIGGLQWAGSGVVSANYYSGQVEYGESSPHYTRSLTDQELYDVNRGVPMCFTPTPYGQSYYVTIRNLKLWFNITGSPSSMSYYIPTQFDHRSCPRSVGVYQTIYYRGLSGQTAHYTHTAVPFQYYWQSPGSTISSLANFTKT